MSFKPLKEKGISIEKQLRCWHDIAHRKYNKAYVDAYTRTRQILMNGIEVEAWNFKHHFARNCTDKETLEFLSQTKRIEDAQQTTINWMSPEDQSILETTLGYEQVAVDLTAWLAQNEPDEYVKETFNFGLLEDFDHLYRYVQWAYLEHGINPNDILQGRTDVMLGRPTQHHHNCNILRLRKPYDKKTASPKTKVNILTVLSGEQQTHNYYAEHGFEYGNELLRETYAEIKDVEEEHVTMYESLIDPTESLYEKLLLHEFTEVCTYHNCMTDEDNDVLMPVWEEFLAFELEHLRMAAELFKKHEKRDPEEVIGEDIIHPCYFKVQKDYVENILEKEIDKRLAKNGEYVFIKELPEDWASHKIQKIVNKEGSPSEKTISLIIEQKKRDIVCASDNLKSKFADLAKKGQDNISLAPDTITSDCYKKIQKEKLEF